MSEGMVGLIVLVAISVTAAIIWHAFAKRYFTASIASALMAAVAFQVAAYVHLGHLDPFFPIAVVASLVAAFVIALLVGLPFRARRKPNVSTDSL